MFTYEILEEIAEKSGHSYSDASILRKINQVQANIFRNYVKAPTYSKLDIQAGLSEYPLPRPMGVILKVVSDGHELKYSNLNGFNQTKYYYILDGTIGLYEIPTANVTGGLVIFHKKAPHELNINDMEAKPDLEDDYHMLLVYGPLYDLLKGNESIEYKNRHDLLLEEFKQANSLPSTQQLKTIYNI